MSLGVQLAGQILCGIPWGVYQTVTTVYAAEVMPVNLRGYLTSYVNLCWVIGQFIGSGVLVGVENRTDQWGWRYFTLSRCTGVVLTSTQDPLRCSMDLAHPTDPRLHLLPRVTDLA